MILFSANLIKVRMRVSFSPVNYGYNYRFVTTVHCSNSSIASNRSYAYQSTIFPQGIDKYWKSDYRHTIPRFAVRTNGILVGGSDLYIHKPCDRIKDDKSRRYAPL